jgi:hypothetical protein
MLYNILKIKPKIFPICGNWLREKTAAVLFDKDALQTFILRHLCVCALVPDAGDVSTPLNQR